MPGPSTFHVGIHLSSSLSEVGTLTPSQVRERGTEKLDSFKGMQPEKVRTKVPQPSLHPHRWLHQEHTALAPVIDMSVLMDCLHGLLGKLRVALKLNRKIDVYH